jgi:hypothetical protein
VHSGSVIVALRDLKVVQQRLFSDSEGATVISPCSAFLRNKKGWRNMTNLFVPRG